MITDLLRDRAAEDPHGVALRVADRAQLTYGDWDRRSDRVAAGLLRRGIARGDRVGLVFGNEALVEYAVAYIAVLRAGAVAVPAGSRFSGRELDAVLDHAGARAVVRGAEDVVELEGGPPADLSAVGVAADDLAEIIYTSGTTGRPKGVACTHAVLMAHDLPPPATGDTHVSFLHAFPIGTQAAQEALRVPLRIGGRTAIAVPTFDGDEVCRLIARYGVRRLQLVPAMAQVLVESGAYRRHDVSSIRRVILSSAPAPPTLFERLHEAFPRASLWNAYALTEAGAARTMTEWDPSRPTAVGRPVGETELRIAGPDGRGVDTGETGEVWLRRRNTPTRSYYRDPEATAVVFAGGWVRTGDVGHVDADGYLHLTGRHKDIIISGGSNVSPVEVENVLYEHPAVQEAAVFGVPHAVLGEDVAAAVVVRSPVTDRELQDLVRARLAEHKVPHRIVRVDRLPRNASGKVLKAELRNSIVTEPAPASTTTVRDDAEARVAAVWEAVLARPHVGPDDDFFALGGHSLAAAQIAARLQDSFGVELPVTAVFDAPTVAELTRLVQDLIGQR